MDETCGGFVAFNSKAQMSVQTRDSLFLYAIAAFATMVTLYWDVDFAHVFAAIFEQL